MLDKIRRYAFWSSDYLKRSPVRNHYLEIKMINENPASYQQTRDKLLSNLLSHAANSTDYYAGYRETDNIRAFPIIDKTIIKENRSHMQSRVFLGQKIHQMRTSGSTGTPFTIEQDLNKRRRVAAELIYFGEKCGCHVGDKIAFMRVWNHQSLTKGTKDFLKNIVAIDISRLSEHQLDKILQILTRQHDIKCILANPASLECLANHITSKKDRKITLPVTAVICYGEMLHESTRNKLGQVFVANIVSRYSNQENGVLAQELPGTDFFIMNHASYFIEFLKANSDADAEDGELARVIVTDLFNYANPMIRYDLGDLAVTGAHQVYERVIQSIHGRKRDLIYKTNGEPVSPMAVMNALRNFDQIAQFQFIQESAERYTLKLNSSREYYADESITGCLVDLLGKDAVITTEHVDTIPVLQSAKFQPVISRYTPEDKKEIKIGKE